MAEAQTKSRYYVWWFSRKEVKSIKPSQLKKIPDFPEWLAKLTQSARRSRDRRRLLWINKSFDNLPETVGALPSMRTDRAQGILITENEFKFLESLPGIITKYCSESVYCHLAHGHRVGEVPDEY